MLNLGKHYDDMSLVLLLLYPETIDHVSDQSCL